MHERSSQLFPYTSNEYSPRGEGNLGILHVETATACHGGHTAGAAPSSAAIWLVLHHIHRLLRARLLVRTGIALEAARLRGCKSSQDNDGRARGVMQTNAVYNARVIECCRTSQSDRGSRERCLTMRPRRIRMWRRNA